MVEGKYFINLSRSPFTPRAGEPNAMLITFADVKTNRPLKEDIIAKIRVAKLKAIGIDDRQFIFEKDNLKVEGGILEFSYTFQEAGLHEVFLDFAFADRPKKVFSAPDFLIDAQRSEQPTPKAGFDFFGALLWLVAGLVIGLTFKRKFLYDTGR